MTGLVCDKCGASPAPGLPAKVGGTHYLIRVREKEARKAEGRHVRATSCGQWVTAPGKEQGNG